MFQRSTTIAALTLALSVSGLLTLVEAQGVRGAAPTSVHAPAPPYATSASPRTHLGVEVGRLFHFQTLQLGSGQTGSFYVDGDFDLPLTVPVGYSFVVTDILLEPHPVTSTTALIDGYVRTNGWMRLPLRHRGNGLGTLTLTSGFAIGAGESPTAFSTGATMEYHLLGYFVEGDARLPGDNFQ